MRRRNVTNAHEKLISLGNVLVGIKEKLNFKELFKNDNPVCLELGMGKGKFIIDLAKKNPNINYIGVEKYEGVILQAGKKLLEEGINNLILVCAEAKDLAEIIEEHSIDTLYLNFSDPWPKARHEKRRLTSNTFLPIYEKILIDNHIIFKTDNRGLFEYSLINLTKNSYKILSLSLDLHKDALDLITTEYEDKLSKNGPIYFVEVKK